MATRKKKSPPPIPKLSLPIGDKAPNIQVLLLAVIAVFVTGVILLELKSVLLPFVISVLLSILFSPLVVALKARNIPTAVSLLIVLLTFALVLFLMSLLIYSSIDSFINEFPKYERKSTALVDGLLQGLSQTAAEYNIELDNIQWTEALQISSITNAVGSGVGTFLNFLTNVFLILLFMLFILAGSGDLENKMSQAFKPHQATQIAKVIRNIETQVRRYLLTKMLISAGTGFLAFLILWITGVDFPLVWAFLTFMLNFIPNIGSLIAIIFPVALSFLQFDSAGQPLLILILLGSMQGLMGNVLEPKLMAFRLNLSALVVLVSLIFWGWLWGILGMILAVPLMATVKIVFENVRPLHPISVLMGGSVKQL